jgi:inactivated superfamily I helicase
MNKIDLHPPLVSMDDDYALWCAQQGALLRAGRFGALDRNNLAEELESLGRSDRFEIESRLKVLLVHLLKWRFQPDKRKPGWRSTIREQRGRIARRLRESPSLKGYPLEVLAEEYSFAVAEAAAETGLAEEAFPAICPFTIEQILDPQFLPD